MAPGATLTARQLPHRARVRRRRRVAHPRRRRQAAGRHRGPLELVPGRPVRRHQPAGPGGRQGARRRASCGSTARATTSTATGRAWSPTPAATAGPTWDRRGTRASSSRSPRTRRWGRTCTGTSAPATAWPSPTARRPTRSTSPTRTSASPFVYAHGVARPDAAAVEHRSGWRPAQGTFELRARQLTRGRGLQPRAVRRQHGHRRRGHGRVERADARRRRRSAGGRGDELEGRRPARLLLAGADRGRTAQARPGGPGLDDGLAGHRDGRHVGIGAARRRCGRAAAAADRADGPAGDRRRDAPAAASRARSTSARRAPTWPTATGGCGST